MIWLVLIGVVSGIISGMGIGGGTILIPALIFLFGFKQQQAQHVNLIYFIPTAIIAVIMHIKNKNIEFKLALKLVLFGILGAIAGSFIAVRIESGVLQKIFGFFLLGVGLMELFKKEQNV